MSLEFEELPLFYRLKQNHYTHDYLNRRCSVIFRAVWRKNNGRDYCEWFGESPKITITRRTPTFKGIEPLQAIHEAFSNKNFMAMIQLASQDAMLSLADDQNIKPGATKLTWECIKIKRVTLCEEIVGAGDYSPALKGGASRDKVAKPKKELFEEISQIKNKRTKLFAGYGAG